MGVGRVEVVFFVRTGYFWKKDSSVDALLVGISYPRSASTSIPIDIAYLYLDLEALLGMRFL